MNQTLTEIKSLLASHGLHPKHRYGQNFLHDGNHMDRILAAAAIGEGDCVLEVGPGTGALTCRLLDAGASVLAVEVDTDLEPILREQFASFGERFELIVADVLAGKHELEPAVASRLGEKPFKLIANLPYNVASPLIANLAVDYPGMSDAVVMVQKEVADRLAAGPGGKDYGQLGVLVQALCEVRRVGVLSPACFWPQPKVASAVVHLKRRVRPLCADAGKLSDLLQTLFSRRRKQLGATLGRDHPMPAGVKPTDRPEQLSVEQLCELAGS